MQQSNPFMVSCALYRSATPVTSLLLSQQFNDFFAVHFVYNIHKTVDI